MSFSGSTEVMGDDAPRGPMGARIILWGVVTLVALGLYGVWMPMAGFERFRGFVDQGEWVSSLALALAFLSAYLTRRIGAETTRKVRRTLLIGTAFALISSGAFVHYVFVFSYELPKAPEIQVGDLPPEIEGKDFLGDPFKLSSLRGSTAVVLFYRGHW